jgi:hypothetical protein
MHFARCREAGKSAISPGDHILLPDDAGKADNALSNDFGVLDEEAGAYSFEAANPRHEHEWRVWEEVALPPGKALVPGVIIHASNPPSHPLLLVQFVNFENAHPTLWLGTPCSTLAKLLLRGIGLAAVPILPELR